MDREREDPFWIVWGGPESRTPTFRHMSAESAEREAARLARQAGGKFFVLRMVASVERVDLKWKDAPPEEPEIPF